MTPEERLKRLELLMNGLLNASQVDPEMARTLGIILTGSSSKNATSENQFVDEAGSSTFTLLKAPDGFAKLGDKNVAFWN